MGRPKKKRFCQGNRYGKAFKPNRIPMDELKQIPLFHDEIEAMRLCDKERLTQEQAGLRMGVSRGTVQRILASGRAKTATAISEGAALIFTKEL